MGKSWDVWTEELSTKAPKTRKIYTKYLTQLLDWMKIDADELFNMHFEALSSSDPRDRFSVARKVRAYMKILEDEGKSSSTQMHVLKAVSSFFKAQRLSFTLNGNKPKVFYEGQRIVEYSEIRKMYEMANNLRLKALLLVAKDSGLRVSDIVQLNVQDVLNALNESRDFILIRLRQKKTGVPARPILGSEALMAIRRYINERKRVGEELQNDSPLFASFYGGESPKRMSATAASLALFRLAKKCEFDKVSAHSLRKFSTTNLQAGGMNEMWLMLIQGRVIGDSRAAYVHPTDSQLIEKYSEAYDKLRIFEPTQNEVVEDLSIKNEEMQERQLELENQNYALQDLIEAMNERLEYFEDMNTRYGHLFADLLGAEEGQLSDELTERISEEILTDVRKQPNKRKRIGG